MNNILSKQKTSNRTNEPTFLAFPPEGFARLRQIIAPEGPLPIGKSTLWNWVKAGKFPSPIKLSPGVTAWRVEDVRAFLEHQTT